MSALTTKSKYTFAALFFVLLIDSMGFGLIFPVLSPIFMAPQSSILPVSVSLEMREILYGLTLGAFSLCMFLGAPILGDLSDQLGRKRVLMLCLLGTAVGAALCAVGIQCKSISLLLFGRAIAGFMAGSQPIAQAAIVDISSVADKTKNLGLISFAGAIGFVIGPVFGGYFSDPNFVFWFNYGTPFFVTAFLALMNGLMLKVTFQETYIPQKKIHFNISKAFTVFAQAFTHRQIRTLSYVFIFSELAWSIYIQFIPLYFVAVFKSSASNIGLFMSFVGVTFGITTALIIRLFLQFFSARTITLIGLIVCGLGLLWPCWVHTVKMQWIASVPVIVGMALSYNTLLTLYSNAASKDEQGWVMGVTSGVVAMSWILGSLFMGLFAYINLAVPFIGAAIFQLLSAVILICHRDLK